MVSRRPVCVYCGKLSDRGFIRECRACRARRGVSPVPKIRLTKRRIRCEEEEPARRKIVLDRRVK